MDHILRCAVLLLYLGHERRGTQELATFPSPQVYVTEIVCVLLYAVIETPTTEQTGQVRRTCYPCSHFRNLGCCFQYDDFMAGTSEKSC